MAAQAAKLPFYLNIHDQGAGFIDWQAIRRDVLAHNALEANTAILTKSGHIALGVSVHVGRDQRVREFEFVLNTFLKMEAFK